VAVAGAAMVLKEKEERKRRKERTAVAHSPHGASRLGSASVVVRTTDGAQDLVFVWAGRSADVRMACAMWMGLEWYFGCRPKGGLTQLIHPLPPYN